MRLFGRKDKEEEEDPRKRTFPKKELTDKEKFFKDKLQRKKKFEIKPWTAKERYIVLGVFISTVVLSAVLGLSSREWKLPNLPRITVPKILSEETIIIEGKKNVVEENEVIKEFERLTEPLSGVYGFFVIKMSDGSTFGDNERETFDAASLNKLPVMLTMYKESEEGNINLSSKYVLKEADKAEGSGSLVGKPAGTAVTYEELVNYMGQQSDNTAFNAARKLLGDEKILKVMREINLPESLLLDNETTPYEIGYFWKTLLDAKYASRETRDALLEVMTLTIYEDWIAKGVPVPVAHKFGSLVHVRNDAGVVLAEEPYILVVMTKGIVEKEADEVIPLFSQRVYQLLAN